MRCEMVGFASFILREIAPLFLIVLGSYIAAWLFIDPHVAPYIALIVGLFNAAIRIGDNFGGGC